MLTFKQFLAEALDFKRGAGMKNTGTDAARHVASYVVPYIDSGEDTHTIKVDHKVKVPGQKNLQTVFSKGQNVQIHGYEVDDKLNYHAIVSSSGGTKHKVPFSRIGRLSLSSTWNDEMATEHMWNYAVANHTSGDNQTIEHSLLDRIRDAKNDASHPLSFENVPDKGFSGGKKQERHRASYYAELEDAAHSVDRMATHPDIRPAYNGKWKAEAVRWVASPGGTTRGVLSKLWLQHGADPKGPAAISKADLIIHPPNHPTAPNSIRVSMKRGGGSQLISSGPEEFGALYHHAADEAYLKDQKHEDVKDVHARVGKIKELMEGARGQDRSVVEQLAKEANLHYQELKEAHPKLKEHVRFEGATGNAKFDTIIHRATHMLTGRTKKKEASVVKLNRSFMLKQCDQDGGAITIGKRPGATLAFRMRNC